MLAETKHEGDRACALILTANLDNRIRELLVAHFVEMTPAQQKDLFEGTGALPTLSSRVRISYACGLLSEDEVHDLNLIRKIRNHFAHEEHGWSFATSAISKLCGSLKMPTRLRQDNPGFAINLTESRDTFQVTATWLTLLLMNRIREVLSDKRIPHLPTSLTMGEIRRAKDAGHA
ncbi:MAG: MltR family transcriptional regulator [Gallionellaceae bacterium]|nr:MltR family transcriptional regulator [Gallionellaceae bacterium]